MPRSSSGGHRVNGKPRWRPLAWNCRLWPMRLKMEENPQRFTEGSKNFSLTGGAARPSPYARVRSNRTVEKEPCRMRDTLALAIRHLDGQDNLTGTFTVNAPDPASTTGGRKIITGTQVGTYTVNCDGTGTFVRTLLSSITSQPSSTKAAISACPSDPATGKTERYETLDSFAHDRCPFLVWDCWIERRRTDCVTLIGHLKTRHCPHQCVRSVTALSKVQVTVRVCTAPKRALPRRCGTRQKIWLPRRTRCPRT